MDLNKLLKPKTIAIVGASESDSAATRPETILNSPKTWTVCIW